MPKIRVHQLAKELEIPSRELLEMLKADGHSVKTASSSIDDDTADKYRRSHGTPAEPTPPQPKIPPPPPKVAVRAKARKPPRKQALTAEEREAMEERRRLRLARLRGEVPPEPAPTPTPATEEPVEAAEAEPREAVATEVSAEPSVEPAAAEPVAQHPVEDGAAAETETETEAEAGEVEAEAEAEAEPAAAAQAGKSAEESAPAAEETAERPAAPAAPATPTAPEKPKKISLPHVISPPPTTPSMPPTTPTPPRARPAASAAPPATPTARSTREFRGPIRKIELPQQTQRQQQQQQPGGPGQQRNRPLGAGITRTFSQRPGTGLGKRKKRRGEQRESTVAMPAPVQKGEGESIRLTEGVSVKELAEKMDVKAKDLIRILMTRGTMVTVNQPLDPEMARSLASEFGFEPEVVSFEEELQAQEEEQILEAEAFEGEDEPRPPIVTVMGHVDHGKTSLLDRLRQTDVASGEAGGITQSIGAYQVEVGDDRRRITFVDTPGHEAFTTMRARGAQLTDIVVLVVAATDSVMPQTIEAINHAKAAEVPILVAVNKVDLPNAAPDRTRQDLMSHGLVAETFGGDIVMVDCSAKTGEGIDDLLELILLQADILELKASPGRRAVGTVVEAGINRGVGPFSNIIVQDGTLSAGEAFIVGSEYGRVRALMNDRGERIDKAGPAMPIQVMGLQGVPKAGDRLQVVEDEPKAKEISEFRQHKRREAELAKSGARGSLQDISKAIAAGEQKELSVVIKADVHGAVEVLAKTLEDLSTEKVRTKIIHSSTGAITDSDVLLASASEPKAVIVGFNIRPERSAADLAEREGVIFRLHTVIYELVDELKQLMTGLLDVIKEEEYLGRAEVRETFKVPRIGMVAGCYVQDGKIVRNAKARVVRDGVVVWEGSLASLKRFKDDVKEVSTGMECGIGLADFNDVKVGDAIETFTIKEIRPTLDG